MYLGSFIQIGQWEGVQKQGKNFEKKMQTSQMPSQNESMKEVSSKSHNDKVFKTRGKIGDTY